MMRLLVSSRAVVAAVLAMAAVVLQPPSPSLAQDADLCDADWLARVAPDAIADRLLAGAHPDRPCPSGDTPLSLAERLVNEARSRLRSGEVDSMAFSLALQRLQTLQNPPARSASSASSAPQDNSEPVSGLLQAAQQRVDALNKLRLAADRGDADAQARLGRMHMFGDDVPLDLMEAVRLSRQAAEQGNADAQSLLGYAYSIGRGVSRDDEEAVRWLRRAAEQGNADAQYRLGRMYERGLGVFADDAEAVRWFRRAAEQGNADARDRLDAAYSDSVRRTAREDEAEAVQRLRRIAEQGNADAQGQLGLAYFLGNGVDKHEAEAARWFRRAAKQGHADAQFGLGSVYLNGGRGVRPSSVLAHMWFSIAVANGTRQATMATLMKGLAERSMTSADISRATQLAGACVASSYQSCER